MVHMDKLNKENCVKGVAKAKPAPDFSKLHKQWDLKLRKGKAVVKKPLTDVQPFTLTQSRKSSSTSSSDGEFQVDASAKESILNCDGIKAASSLQHRVTIGVTSQINRPSRIPQRTSLHAKSVFGDLTSSRIELSKSPKPSYVRKRNGLQDFSVDFQPDEDALKSILNCEGIPASRTPSKLSSQFGPTKSKRVKGRVVPFQKPASNSRFSFHARTSQADVLSSKKQRWSIYSRDSFTTKPDLMTWLKGLMEQPVAAAPINKTGAKSPAKHTEHSDKSQQRKENHSGTPSQTIGYSGLKFNKTLVGYQGDLERRDGTANGETMLMKNDFPEASYNTPSKQKIDKTEVNDGSAVRSILKKKPCDSYLQRTPFKTILEEKTPNRTKEKAVASVDCTPLRLSAYARNQKMLGLPLPKENRYEHMGERIDEPANASKNDDATITDFSNGYHANASVRSQSTVERTNVKHVRWAENLRNSLEPKDKTNADGDADQFLFDSVKMPTCQPLVNLKHDDKLARIDRNSASVKTNSSWADILSQQDGALTTESDQDRDCTRLKSQIDDVNSIIKSVRTLSSDQNLLTLSRNNDMVKTRRHDVIYKMDNSLVRNLKVDDDVTRIGKESCRPLPVLDGKLIEKLMSFTEDEDVYDYSSIFTSRELLMGNLQSTLLIQTPTVNEPPPCIDLNTETVAVSKVSEAPVSENETPPCVDLSISNDTISRVLEAPCKRVKALARTPYKQKMLEYLENALALSRKRASESLNCTNGIETTLEELDETNRLKTEDAKKRPDLVQGVQINESSNVNLGNDKLSGVNDDFSLDVVKQNNTFFKGDNYTPSTSAQCNLFVSREDTTLVNILSPSMRKFSSDALTTCSQNQGKPLFAVSTQKFNIVEDTKISEEVSCKPIIRPASFNPNVNELSTESKPPLETKINQLSYNVSLTKSASQLDYSSQNVPSLLLTNGFAENPQQLLQPLFSTLTSGHAFKSSEKHQKVNTMNLILKPSTFSYIPNSSNQEKAATSAINRITSCNYAWTSSNQYSKINSTAQSGVITSSAALSDVLTSSASVLRPSILASHLPKFSSTDAIGSTLNDRLSANQTSNTWCVTNQRIDHIVEDTMSESSMVDQDTDVCLVFKNIPEKPSEKPSGIEIGDSLLPESTGDTCDDSSLTCSDKPYRRQDCDTRVSAFRHVPSVCNVIPRHQPVCVSSTDKSSEMKLLCKLIELLVAKPYTRESVLNAEVSLYSKFGEITAKYGHRIDRKRDGASCTLEKVLTYGDEKHFVPVASLG